MKHSKASYLLDAFDRGELPDSTRLDLDRHVAGCLSCTAQVEQTLQMKAFLVESSEMAPSEAFESALVNVRQRTMRAVRQSQAERESTPFRVLVARFSWTLMAVPATVAAALVLFLVVRHQNQGQMASLPNPGPTSAYLTSVTTPGDFRLLRDGAGLKIEWARNGRRQHKVRTASDPQSVQLASGQVVRGKSWTESNARPASGSVTYYLID